MIQYVDMVVGGMVGAWENTFCAVLIGIGQASTGFYSIGIGQTAVLIGIGQASFIYMYWHVCPQKEMVVVAVED